uniref:TPX2_importin domain-containing protein n=1 Tax=Macrostomum lignano TaxID=282301 RepID=A0A1I8G770_9PLAT
NPDQFSFDRKRKKTPDATSEVAARDGNSKFAVRTGKPLMRRAASATNNEKVPASRYPAVVTPKASQVIRRHADHPRGRPADPMCDTKPVPKVKPAAKLELYRVGRTRAPPDRLMYK